MALTNDGVTPHYRYYLARTLSDDLVAEVELTEVSYSTQIRRAGELSGKLTFRDADEARRMYTDTMPGLMSVYVTRDRQPVWGGIINARDYTANGRELSIQALTYESAFYRRTVWHSMSFANTIDQFDVVRAVIAHMQTDFVALHSPGTDRATPYPDNASFGIQVEIRDSGHTQDLQSFSGWEFKTVGEWLEAFSDNLNGFEYNIAIGWDEAQNKFTKVLVFRDAPPSQIPADEDYEGERPGLDENYFEFPGNVVELGYSDGLEGAGTRQFVVGKQPEGVEDEELPTPYGAWENEPYLATNWPIFENVESSDHDGVSLQSTLDNYAEIYGRRATPPVPAWTVSVNGSMNPQVGTYKVGDWCRLVVTDPFISQSANSVNGTNEFIKRIAQIQVQVPDTNQLPEVVALTLINEYDEGDA